MKQTRSARISALLAATVLLVTAGCSSPAKTSQTVDAGTSSGSKSAATFLDQYTANPASIGLDKPEDGGVPVGSR